MKQIIISLIVSFLYPFLLLAQTYNYPTIGRQIETDLKIVRVEKTDSITRIDFEYVNSKNDPIWLYIKDPKSYEAYFIYANTNKYKLLRTEGLEDIVQANQGVVWKFTAYFEPLPRDVNTFNLFELSTRGWNFHDISLIDAKIESYNLNKTPKLYSKVLVRQGKVRENPDVADYLLGYLPSGTSVDIYELVDDYYKINYRGRLAYIDKIYFDNSVKSPSKVQYSSGNPMYPRQNIKSFYKEGKGFQYYINDGISVTVGLSSSNIYGKYIVAYVAIENFSGAPFTIHPENIVSILSKNNEEFYGRVLTYSEYMKKVENRQAWSSALVAFGEYNAANQAAYSQTRTSSSTTSYVNSSGNVYGYYGNAYFNIQGTSDAHIYSSTNSLSETYNGAAAYQANQKAGNNIRNNQEQLFAIKRQLDQGYLKIHTLSHQERVIGYINISYEKCDEIDLIIPVNGVDYSFGWRL